ncbi:hypothetical protein PMIT1318_00635 [Prochlorococcus marinus str. MIT 1318]|nr:hypothetical protein PMIT1318_00635 [Prochlorococcus marinus str. MIT 1318]
MVVEVGRELCVEIQDYLLFNCIAALLNIENIIVEILYLVALSLKTLGNVITKSCPCRSRIRQDLFSISLFIENLVDSVDSTLTQSILTQS